MKLTLKEAKPTIARIMGVCPDDSRLADYINEAVMRLLPRGEWVGTTARMRLCVNSGCLTWPRQVETILSASICSYPIKIRNQWFEFQGNGPGYLRDDSGCGNILVDRGEAPTFDDMRGNAEKIRVYADVSEDNTPIQYITLQGHDNNNNWIRTQDPETGEYIDGEKVRLSTTPQISENIFLSLSGVQKPVTQGRVYMYAYNQTTQANERALAIYEPDETLPSYRRSFIPGLSNMAQSAPDSSCRKVQVEILAKLKFIPVRDDPDYILIGNLQALKLAVMSILKEENNLPGEAAIYMNGGFMRLNGQPVQIDGAITILERELDSWLGHGTISTPRIESPWLWGGAVENAV